MDLKEFKVYQKAMDVAERCWEHVIKWDFFAKDTIGKQLIRAVDSIAANLSEGYGRYHFKEAKNFGYYSRGSLYETSTWLKKALNRDLINSEDYFSLSKDLKDISIRLNNYIKSIGKTQKEQVSENGEDYFLNQEE